MGSQLAQIGKQTKQLRRGPGAWRERLQLTRSLPLSLSPSVTWHLHFQFLSWATLEKFNKALLKAGDILYGRKYVSLTKKTGLFIINWLIWKEARLGFYETDADWKAAGKDICLAAQWMSDTRDWKVVHRVALGTRMAAWAPSPIPHKGRRESWGH